MNHSVKLAIFDMDGTILHTLDDLAASTNHALKHFGFPSKTPDEVRSAVGNGTRMLIANTLPPNTADTTIDAVHREFRLHYNIHYNDSSHPYAGIKEVILAIRRQGIMTAVLSNKPDSQVQALARQHFPNLFDFAVGERPETGRKPSPATVNFVLNSLSIQRDHAVYIGDSEVDVQTAENSHLRFIGVCWGFREKCLLQSLGVERIADTPADILSLL